MSEYWKKKKYNLRLTDLEAGCLLGLIERHEDDAQLSKLFEDVRKQLLEFWDQAHTPPP